MQLFGDMAHAPLDGEGRPVPQREEIRRIIEQDFEWEDGPEASLQCTIERCRPRHTSARPWPSSTRLWSSAPIARSRPLEASPSPSSPRPSRGSPPTSEMAAESYKEALQLQVINMPAICAADVAGLVDNMLEIISVSEAVGGDCDCGPGGPGE